MDKETLEMIATAAAQAETEGATVADFVRFVEAMEKTDEGKLKALDLAREVIARAGVVGNSHLFKTLGAEEDGRTPTEKAAKLLNLLAMAMVGASMGGLVGMLRDGGPDPETLKELALARQILKTTDLLEKVAMTAYIAGVGTGIIEFGNKGAES